MNTDAADFLIDEIPKSTIYYGDTESRSLKVSLCLRDSVVFIVR